MLPCIIHEDDHLLVADKPAGWNTHAPAPFAGEGLYDWLRNREPHWADLAILHRLDKETSGLIVFGKTPEANRGLTQQFEARQVRKRYRFLTDQPAAFSEKTVRSALVRTGDRYVARPPHAGAREAVTHFRCLGPDPTGTAWEALPVSGLTHQIRVHAASAEIPILGDTLYGSTSSVAVAPTRLCLHAAELEFRHPVTREEIRFESSVDFAAHDPLCLRRALVEMDQTNAYRVVHGAGDHRPGLYLDRLGDYLLWQHDRSDLPTDEADATAGLVRRLADQLGVRGVYVQRLQRRLQSRSPEELAPRPLWGEVAPPAWFVRENGVRFEIRFTEGYSVGLFLDQRDNRRALLVNHAGREFPVVRTGMAGAAVLNTFAYTCGFSVCAALAGARVTSIDLSQKNLDWGRRNFELNGLNPADHAFLAGDVFDWGRRLHRRGQQFDVVLLDPPTFSRSRSGKVFRAEKDYPELIASVLPLLRAPGTLLVSTNAASLAPERFLDQVRGALRAAGRSIAREQFRPQPPDHPSGPEEPAFLKTCWFQVGGAAAE